VSTQILDFDPVIEAVTDIVLGVPDDQLGAPTPCDEASLGDLIDHLDGLSMVFTAAAKKSLDGPQAPTADASRLGVDWRRRVPARLEALADAWRDEAAWVGMTQVAGGDLPAEVAGVIAINEIIVHGWDIAVASGQDIRCEPGLVEAAYGFVQSTVAAHPGGSPGLFGPPVPVPDDAARFDRLLALTGRDPGWKPRPTRE
jgi:uncharacterized protein (TIGR03086 family)